MISNNIILAQTTSPMENLQQSETDLQQLDQQFATLQDEYRTLVNNYDQPSFFNFDNVYFWFVIVGLMLLVFGLWYWLLDLKRDRIKKSRQLMEEEKNEQEKVEEIKIEPELEKPVIKTLPKPVESSRVVMPIKPPKRKVVKIKVRKVSKT